MPVGPGVVPATRVKPLRSGGGKKKTSLRVSLKLSYVKSYSECLRWLWSPYGETRGCWGRWVGAVSMPPPPQGPVFISGRYSFSMARPNSSQTPVLPPGQPVPVSRCGRPTWTDGTPFSSFFPPRWDWKTSPTEGWAGLPKRPLTVRLGQSDLTAGGDWSTASLPSDVPRSLVDTLMSPVKYSQVPLPGTPVSDGGLSPGGEVQGCDPQRRCLRLLPPNIPRPFSRAFGPRLGSGSGSGSRPG